MVSSTIKTLPDSLALGAFEYSFASSLRAGMGVCGETKLSIVRGLPASCTEKSVFFRSRTGAPSLPLTPTVRRTSFWAARGTASNPQTMSKAKRVGMRMSENSAGLRIARTIIHFRQPSQRKRKPVFNRWLQRNRRPCSLRQCLRRNNSNVDQRSHDSGGFVIVLKP